MERFIDIKVNDEMYSIVFGVGKVIFVLAEALRLEGCYAFEVEYDNGQKVYYTEDGRPSWCKDLNNCTRTVYYKDEVNFDNLENQPRKKVLKKHQIDRLRYMDILEMLSPAGAWIDANLMPDIMVDNAINDGEYHLFREMVLEDEIAG
ncbi:hypothetical protein [Sulfurimonas sp.]|jgi:hypothetical protein|uniref:hypothetical protein n=1 Tax=Sulfurimonas sp. TaxID=2022749 RepID=UPI002A3646EC|nr:hypothetical protein [Sulfurimonas sp.]MDY0123957.1 hypothetical protein [Sulfurimonas sp.]